jgi:FdhE protein
MTEQQHAATQRMREAIDLLRSRTPELANVFEAFQDLFIARAAAKADFTTPHLPEIVLDPLRYGQGVPLLRKEEFAMPFELFKACAGRIIPAMEKGFPGIRSALHTIEQALAESSADGAMVTRLQIGTAEDLEELAGTLQIDAAVLEFVALQILKPYAERLAEIVPALPEDFIWAKGYCPVCGSWPEMGFVEAKEGIRNLRCSFCGHQWRFMRTQCPFCETLDQEKLELYFAEDRPTERVELCHECKRYLVSMDLRDQIGEVVREVAPLGLVHLDILAQERGFLPGAVCAWNLVSG